MRRSSTIVGAALLVFGVLLDQATKISIRSALDVGQSVHIAGPVWLTHVENAGSVFGLGQGYVLIPTIATILILVAIPLILRHLQVRYAYTLTSFEAACIGLIGAGAIGNLIDRVTRSAVTDFVDVELWPGFHWPAFNVADSCVVVGTILLLIAFYLHGRHDAQPDVSA